jgi:hypothetical protein
MGARQMAKKWTVREGQRYVQRPSTPYRHVIWKVGTVKAGNAPIPHAHLVKVDDPLRCKTISCNTLANPSFYELLSDTGNSAGQT